jgi:hypothetical protein
VKTAISPRSVESITKNTWVMGFSWFFADLVSAARCAMDIQSEASKLDMASPELPEPRILDCGSV